MELGPFEVGKHKQKRKYKVPLLLPQPTLCQVVNKVYLFLKVVEKSHQKLLMQIPGDNSEVAALKTTPSLAASVPSDAA